MNTNEMTLSQKKFEAGQTLRVCAPYCKSLQEFNELLDEIVEFTGDEKIRGECWWLVAGRGEWGGFFVGEAIYTSLAQDSAEILRNVPVATSSEAIIEFNKNRYWYNKIFWW